MSEESPVNDTPQTSFFWPLLLSSLAFNAFLFFHLYNISTDTWRLHQNNVSLTQQTDAYRKNIMAARNVQTLLQALANDLIDMSTTDPDIRKIIDKYQIRRSPQPGAQNTPAPASKD
jgi:hypothetical protein